MADEAGARRLMTAVMTAVAEPDLWPEALDDLARFFGGVAAMVEFHSPDGKLVRLGPRGTVFEQRYLDLYLEHYAATCPRARTMMTSRARAVQSEEMIGTDTVLDRHPYYVDFLGPQRLKYHLALRLRRTRNELGVLAVQRLRVDGPATSDEIAWMYELAPFLRAAFRARALLGDIAAGVGGLLSALARLSAPLALLRADGQLLFQNDAADVVTAREPNVDWPGLMSAWRQSTAGTEDPGSVPIQSPAGTWLARIFDLSGAFDLRAVDGGVYVAMLIPQSANASTAVIRSRGLTGAEAAVLKLLIGGATPLEIALEQRVSIATVRTHIARLHEKFGVRRTLDVVRLALADGFGGH
jgi:DNA-binding CsgD family transcriptional regulator